MRSRRAINETYRTVIESLVQYNLEYSIDEIINKITDGKYNDARERKSIDHWNSHILIDWLNSFQSISNEEKANLQRFIQKEFINGETFEMLLREEYYHLLPISYTSYHIIKTVLKQWSNPIHTLPAIALDHPIGKSSEFSSFDSHNPFRRINWAHL